MTELQTMDTGTELRKNIKTSGMFVFVTAITVLFLSSSGGVNGANILFASPASNPYIPSHVRLASVLSRELVQRGHRVVVLSSSIVKDLGYSAGSYSEVITFDLPLDEDVYLHRHERLFDLSVRNEASMQELMEFFQNTTDHCGYLWRDQAALKRLKDEKFDMVILNPFGACEFLLHCYLDKIPFAAFTPTTKYPSFNEDIFHMPSPSSYVPGWLSNGFTDHMTFVQRAQNFLSRTLGGVFMYFTMVAAYNVHKEESNLCPEMTLSELMGKADLWLANTDIALNFPHPYTPNYVPIGGLMAEPSKPLPKV